MEIRASAGPKCSKTPQPLASAADDITPRFKDQFVTFHLLLHLILLLLFEAEGRDARGAGGGGAGVPASWRERGEKPSLYTRTSDELIHNKSSPLPHAQFPVALRVPSIRKLGPFWRLSMVKLVSVCQPNHTQNANINEDYSNKELCVFGWRKFYLVVG